MSKVKNVNVSHDSLPANAMATSLDNNVRNVAGEARSIGLSDDVITLLELPGRACLLVSCDERVVYVNHEFTQRFSPCDSGEALTEVVKKMSMTDVGQVKRLLASEVKEVVFEHGDVCLSLRCVPVGGDQRMLYSNVTESAWSAGLNAYLQARDSMFTTSRSVSVTEMAATLAHEINTPVGTITNLLGGIKSRLQATEDVSPDIIDALTAAQEQARFTSSIVSRIRDYTQARQPQHKELVVGEICEEAIVLLDWFFQMHQCDVRLEPSGKHYHVRGDRVMLEQVLLNLLRNAAEAVLHLPKSKRRIDISFTTIGERLRIAIRDYGKGLRGADDTLFTPFSTQKETGMGIGLNICRSFLELHRGRMWLSDAPDDQCGCIAIVELPVVEILAETDPSISGRMV